MKTKKLIFRHLDVAAHTNEPYNAGSVVFVSFTSCSAQDVLIKMNYSLGTIKLREASKVTITIEVEE